MWNWSTSFLCRGRISGCTSFSWTASPTPRMCTCYRKSEEWSSSSHESVNLTFSIKWSSVLPAPASDPSDVWSSLCPLGDCWCSPYQRRPGVQEDEDEDLPQHRFTTHHVCTRPSVPPSQQHYLLISGNAPVHSSIYDPIEAHAERVDVAMMLPVLVLADQSPQLLGLILHHINSVLQRAHLHLQINTLIHPLAFLERNYVQCEMTKIMLELLTTSLLSTSAQREIPGRGRERISVVLSIHRLC